MSFPSKLAIFSFILFSLFVSVAHAENFATVDSIGVQRVGDKIFILHRVSDQETLFSISRRYKVSMGDIQGANEALKQGLKAGETILVPHGQAAVTAPTAPTPVVTTPIASTSVATTPVVIALDSSSSTTSTNTTIHKVKSGETLFAIAKKYGVTVEELKTWNSLKEDKVRVDQSIKIERKSLITYPDKTPIKSNTPVFSSEKEEVRTEEKPKKEEVKKEDKLLTKKEQAAADKKEASISTPAVTSSSPSGEWIAHTILVGETLFALSKQYGSSVEELIQWNALSSNNLKVGQSIKVGRVEASAAAIPTVGEAKTNTSSTSASTNPTGNDRSATSASSTSSTSATNESVSTATNTSGGFSNIKELGLAELIPNTSGNKKYLVLHRTAPVGSVIRVKNEENDLTIFARVVGVLPETGDNAKLLIKLSQAAFDQLKGVNQRFPVEILY